MKNFSTWHCTLRSPLKWDFWKVAKMRHLGLPWKVFNGAFVPPALISWHFYIFRKSQTNLGQKPNEKHFHQIFSEKNLVVWILWQWHLVVPFLFFYIPKVCLAGKITIFIPFEEKSVSNCPWRGWGLILNIFGRRHIWWIEVTGNSLWRAHFAILAMLSLSSFIF